MLPNRIYKNFAYLSTFQICWFWPRNKLDKVGQYKKILHIQEHRLREYCLETGSRPRASFSWGRRRASNAGNW